MNLNELRDQAYKTACEHGWHEENLSNEHYLCLVISELMEAVEADRKRMHAFRTPFEDFICRFTTDPEHAYKVAFDEYIKDSVEDELSDAVIRLLDLAGLKGIDLENFNYEESHISDYSGLSFTEAMFGITKEITNGFTEDDVLEEKIHSVLNEIFSFCEDMEIDIEWHIEQKMKYNELRPYKHGNKKY